MEFFYIKTTLEEKLRLVKIAKSNTKNDADTNKINKQLLIEFQLILQKSIVLDQTVNISTIKTMDDDVLVQEKFTT